MNRYGAIRNMRSPAGRPADTSILRQHKIRSYIFFFIFLLPGIKLFGQCPANLGFETGTFNNWSCFSGKIDSITRQLTTTVTGPLTNRHVMQKNPSVPKLDPYGGFPVNCPNGSNYSVRIGNDSAGAQIDGVSYTVTIPADKDVYSIIYNYAVVLQNPNHNFAQQPRFNVKVLDIATNQYLECSSFDFSASASLPGFKLATGINARGTSVYYKPWSPITIKLVGYAGKTLKLEFTVNDCTLGAHFGYAYLDINEDCSTPIKGNILCLGAASTILTAPFGFKEYNWYTADFSTLLGTQNTLALSPVPAPGTMFALEVYPFPGSGCVDTLYTTMERAAVPFVFKTKDSAGACPPLTTDITAASITNGSTAGLTFSYFTDFTQTEYVESPEALSKSGVYYIKAANAAGCIDIKPIIVSLDTLPAIIITDPAPYYYPNKADITNPLLISGDKTGLTFSYWKDAAATVSVPNPEALEIAGTYYIETTTRYGCSIVNPVQVVIQIPPPVNAFSPNNDGINDTWQIPALSLYPDCRVDIFDRYGRVLFHSIGYNKPWDGKFNGKPLPPGTYYFVIKASEKLAVFAGSITILL
jgi:gliding motility-associated-like protein